MLARTEQRTKPLLIEGRTCWRKAPASRVAFLIDAAAYFEAVREAILRAERSILILSWEIDSRERLLRVARTDALPDTIGPLLDEVVRRRPSLEAHVLGWSSFVYALEREKLSQLRLGWRTHRRLHYRLDSHHPLWVSQHQKVVVIDDRIAFAGGLDLTSHRWDTPEHKARDPRRTDPTGHPYGPFHDAMIAVDGEAAKRLGDLARERWRRATGEVLAPPGSTSSDPWPAVLEPAIERATVGIARTEAPYQGRPAVREVEALYLEAIRTAERSIYLENQYLTLCSVTRALMARLSAPASPEVVMVLPSSARGLVAESSMGELRLRTLAKLREADRSGRFRAFVPVVSDNEPVYVHAKLMIVDDRLLRIGSSNLNNRCMGVDTECDVAIEAGPKDHHVREAIRRLRARLLAEHLGAEPETVEPKLDDSLIAGIDAHQDGARRLLPIEDAPDGDPVQVEDPDAVLLDPSDPVAFDQIAARLLPTEARTPAKSPLVRLLTALLLMLMMAGAWRWTPLRELVDTQALESAAIWFRGHPLAWLLVPAIYVIGGLLMAPLLLMILLTALTFSPLSSGLLAFAGALSSAVAGYGIGRALGRTTIDRMISPRLSALKLRISRHGFLTMLMMRLVPLAPYAMVNMLAGATRISFSSYVLGTVVGLTPGIIGITAFGYHLGRAASAPDPTTFGALGAVVLAIAAGVLAIHRLLGRAKQRAG